jgi:hypothetical protein
MLGGGEDGRHSVADPEKPEATEASIVVGLVPATEGLAGNGLGTEQHAIRKVFRRLERVPWTDCILRRVVGEWSTSQGQPPCHAR